MPDIFDNLKAESSIGPALKSALENFDTCDVATGYFDLRGWASFADIVETKSASWQPTDPPAVRVACWHGDACRLGAHAFGAAGHRTASNLRLRNQRHRARLSRLRSTSSSIFELS